MALTKKHYADLGTADALAGHQKGIPSSGWQRAAYIAAWESACDEASLRKEVLVKAAKTAGIVRELRPKGRAIVRKAEALVASIRRRLTMRAHVKAMSRENRREHHYGLTVRRGGRTVEI